MKRYSSTAITFIMLMALPLLLTSCDDDDNGIEGDIYYNLTSVTWYAEDGGYYPDGQEFYSSDYWDFYGDGEGVWESYLEDGYGTQHQTRYFQWDFSPYDPTVIHLYIEGVGHEYWAIDIMTPYRFSSYVSYYDPYYYPEAEYSYQTLYATGN